MKLFISYLSLLQHLFTRSKPAILQLAYIDFILDKKPLFLISWQFKKRYKLKLHSINKTYISSQGSVIIKIPSNIDSIPITVSSMWRKKKYTAVLKKVQVSDELANQLVQNLHPLKKTRLKISGIQYKETLPLLKTPLIEPHNVIAHVKPININLHNHKVIYPN